MLFDGWMAAGCMVHAGCLDAEVCVHVFRLASRCVQVGLNVCFS